VTRSDDSSECVTTQILTELFRYAGYDGIAFRRAFGEHSINLALFDLESAVISSGQLFEATSVKVNFQERGNPPKVPMRVIISKVLTGLEAEVYDFPSPAAISGADPINDRPPGFSDMLSYLHGNGARIILVESASRFAARLVNANAWRRAAVKAENRCLMLSLGKRNDCIVKTLDQANGAACA